MNSGRGLRDSYPSASVPALVCWYLKLTIMPLGLRQRCSIKQAMLGDMGVLALVSSLLSKLPVKVPGPVFFPHIPSVVALLSTDDLWACLSTEAWCP